MGGAVTWGLPGAWVVHDLEEPATVPGRLRRNVPGLRKRFPSGAGGGVAAGRDHGRGRVATAVGVMGAVVGTAAAAGRLTGGRSGFCQSVLTGFGLHGVMHLAQAAAVRGYPPGSVTSPLVVLPFTPWARGRLRKAGVLRPARPRDTVAGSAAAGAGHGRLARRGAPAARLGAPAVMT
ncbi:HXXEE domain-containing protein [Streptomyces griseoincarnatus]